MERRTPRHGALLLRRGDEGLQVVTDDLGHAGCRHRDHLRFVELVGVLQSVHHVVEAAEDRRIFGHRRRHRRRRLLEVPGKVRAIIRHASLRSVHEAHRLLEAGRDEHGTQRLTRLGRVHRQRLACEVLLAILPRLGPSRRVPGLLLRRHPFGLALPLEHLLVFGLQEQRGVIEELCRLTAAWRFLEFLLAPSRARRDDVDGRKRGHPRGRRRRPPGGCAAGGTSLRRGGRGLRLPRRLEVAPDGVVDRQVHVSSEIANPSYP